MPTAKKKHLDPQVKNCDLVATEALLQYYDKPYSQRSLLDYLHHHSYGSIITEIADCLLQHGIQTTIVSANPHLFSHEEWEKFSLRENYPDEKNEFHTSELQRVIKKGVLLRTEIPTENLITEEVKAKRPVIISCNRAILKQTTGIAFHYAVISAADEKTFTVINAIPTEKQTKIPKTVVMFAIHSIASQNPMAGSIILTKDKDEKESK